MLDDCQRFVVGVRIAADTGVEFIGLDDVNSAIRNGYSVLAIEPGDVLIDKVAEDADTAELALVGVTLTVLMSHR